MKVSPNYLLVTLLLTAWGYASVGVCSDRDSLEQIPVPAPGMNQTLIIENPEAFGEGTEQENQTEYEMLAPDESAGTETEAAQTGDSSEKATIVPFNGAFGILLGESFQPWMVAKIISQEDKKYKTRGENQTEYTGTLYQVEPIIPNKLFNEYSLLTNKDGIVYSITGKQMPKEKVSACQLTKELAGMLEDKYGRPRGKGLLGDWYAFRLSKTGPYQGIRLYSQRCRNGRYSIVYTDEAAMMQEAAPKVEPEEMIGL